MIASLVLFFFAFFSAAFAIKFGDFMQIFAPESPDHLKLCIVEKLERVDDFLRARVIFINEGVAEAYSTQGLMPDEAFGHAELLENQLQEIEPRAKISIIDPLVLQNQLLVLSLSNLVHDNIYGRVDSFDDETLRLRHRLIGAWIEWKFGLEAMEVVCKLTSWSVRDTVAHFWKGIGGFQL